ncbi:MAG: response regulator [Candidatus Omnitrophica bacterium]|nr:response regulator [Candidatus Omnitrophota bacterium]
MYSLKILSVDDDPDILDVILATLEGDYQVVQALNGKDAIETAKKESPDLLILDYNLPDMQGPDICAILRKDPLFLNTPILMLTGKGEIEDKVKGLEAGVDDYMVKPFEPQELVARVRMLIRRSTINLDANPLTRLPGNVSITRELEDKIKNERAFAVLYNDLDNFKALNDYYGFDAGDHIIKETARILVAATQEKGTVKDFVGHIGGDDFVIITKPENAEGLAKKIIADFDKLAPNLFDEKDRVKGFIETKGRDGLIHKFGFPTISIGIITTDTREFTHVAEVSSVGAELKKLAKKFEESKYVVDRRNI